MLANKVLLSHNLRFNAGLLNAEFRSCGLEDPTSHGIDRLQMSRQIDVGARSHKLAYACLRYDVETSAGHRAREDAIAVAQLFVAMCARNGKRFARFIPGTYRIG